MPERPRTQFLDLKSADFGPRQEEAGARIARLARPPPTELIETHQGQVRAEEEVLAELDATQTTLAARSRRVTRVASLLARQALDAARHLAADVSRALKKEETWRVMEVARPTPLSLLPEEDTETVLPLEAGTRVVVYLEIDAPPGWVGVRTPSGQLGYLPSERLIARDPDA